MLGAPATYLGMNRPGVTLIDFTAAWCPPCRQLDPILKELEGEYRGRAHITTIDVQDDPVTAQAFRVTAMPTMVLLRDGKEVGRMVGLRPKRIVAAALERALAGDLAITGA